MNMEIEFLHRNFAGEKPKVLMDHTQRMASGGAPFFSTTLSLVYDKLVEKTFAQATASSSGLGNSSWGEGQGVMNSTNQASGLASQVLNPTGQVSNPTNQVLGPTNQMTNPATHFNPPWTPTPTFTLPTNQQTTTPTPEPSSAPARFAWLRCTKCGTISRLRNLVQGMHCSVCPVWDMKHGRPKFHMKCQLCGIIREKHRNDCINGKCQARFR